MDGPDGLVEFAHKCGQSLDWLVYGDVRAMGVDGAMRKGWRHPFIDA